jgi:recombination protein RecR
MARRAKAPVSLDAGQLPEILHRVVLAFGLLPGVGEKTATRHAIWLASGDLGADGPLARIEAACALARARVMRCPSCRALCDAATVGEVCPLCADTGRDPAILCVVASEADRLAIERSGAYRGRYYVLGALVDPLEGVGAGELPLNDLANAITPGMEMILALPGTTEGDATAMVVARALDGTGVKVSALARGIAHGASLEHADQVTVARAIAGRTVM